MKIKIIIYMLLIYSNSIKAQCCIDSLYDSLLFTNGICKKTITATYLSCGKNQISSETNDNIRKIRKQIKYIPQSSVSFLYKDRKYYISVSNECDMSKYSKGDKIKIEIIFFKDIKQPYKYKNPFSFISSIYHDVQSRE